MIQKVHRNTSFAVILQICCYIHYLSLLSSNCGNTQSAVSAMKLCASQCQPLQA